MPSTHSRLSPSGAHRWMRCAASVAMNNRVPHTTSSYAEEGTAAHELAARTLKTEAKMCDAFEGQYSLEAMTEKFTPEMCKDVQKYVDALGDYHESAGGLMLIEQQVDYSDVVGIPESFGTADCIILSADKAELQLHDLKFGYRIVSANRNEQLMTYALAAISDLARKGMDMSKLEQIRLCIHQPRHNVVSEWTCSIDELNLFALALKEGAERAVAVDDAYGKKSEIPAEYFNPGEKQCQYCDAKDVCPALTKHNLETITDMFVDLTLETADTLKVKIEEGTERLATEDNATLAVLLQNVDLIEDWCKALRSRASGELMEGRPVPGYKLVRGKQGNRAWDNEDTVEELMKGMRLKSDDMYTRKLISPTAAEKLVKADSPRRWKTLQAHITRSEGGIHVAPDTDPRPAIEMKPAAELFSDLTPSNVDDLV